MIATSIGIIWSYIIQIIIHISYIYHINYHPWSITCWTNYLCHMIGIVNVTWPILDTLRTIKLLVAWLVDNPVVTKRLVRMSFYPCKIDLL